MCTVNIKVNEALLRGMLPELLLKPSEIVDDCGEAIELESFRADLHRMIDEVYAEQ